MEPSLPDELLLLALHDEEGHVLRAAGPALRGALVGATMMELSLRGRLSEGTGHQLVADSTPTGDEILDDIGRRIAEAERRQDAATWVRQLTQELPDLKERLLDRMVAAGVLERRERRILWVYPMSSFPQGDGQPELQARERIRAAVLSGESPDARTLALISLVQACNLLDELFAPDERPAARRRIAELIAGRTAEGPTLATMLGIGALFGLVGATLQYGYRRLRDSFGGRVGYLGSAWDPDILEPWLTAALDSESPPSDGFATDTWEERSAAASSTDTASAESTQSSGGWASSLWANDGGSQAGADSGERASSGGWLWWWGGGSASDSGSSESGGSWWDSGSSDAGSSDSGGWSSGSSDSGNSDSSSSDSGSSDSGSSSC